MWLRAGRLDKEDINTKVDQLSRKIEEVKLEVNDALIKKYAEFCPLSDATKQLYSRVKHVETEMTSMIVVIEKQVNFDISAVVAAYGATDTEY